MALNLLRADCESGFLGVLGGAMVQGVDVFEVSIAFAIYNEGYLAYVKVPRDLLCDVHKSIGQREDRDPLEREGPNEMKSNEKEKRELLGIQDYEAFTEYKMSIYTTVDESKVVFKTSHEDESSRNKDEPYESSWNKDEP